jgi:hypothetical protein
MGHRRVSAVLAGAFAVLSASAVTGDDLADLKATHEQSLKAIVTNDVDQLLRTVPRHAPPREAVAQWPRIPRSSEP